MYNFILMCALLSFSMLVFGLLASINMVDFNVWSAVFLYFIFKHIGEMALSFYSSDEEE